MRLQHIITGAYILLAVLLYGCGRDTPGSSGGRSSPFVSFTVSPSSGGLETVFSVDGASSFSRTETELMFRWDWEDDGVWDTEFSVDASAAHVYSSLGYKKIKLEAEDQSGASGTARREIFVTVASKEMILIPAGEFLMGSPEGVGNDDEHPQHEVYLDDFLIGKYEVTTGQYVEFLNAIGGNQDDDGNRFVNTEISSIRLEDREYIAMKGWEDHPITGVSWYGAKAYAEWESGRLLTEAEWEKAARGGDGRTWPWGNLWEIGKCNSWEAGRHNSAPVGSYPASVSPYGVHDMAGNVFEWVADWYQVDYYRTSLLRNPKGPDFGGFRVMRSGSWVEPGNKCRTPFRFGQSPDSADTDSGFRIAKDVGE